VPGVHLPALLVLEAQEVVDFAETEAVLAEAEEVRILLPVALVDHPYWQLEEEGHETLPAQGVVAETCLAQAARQAQEEEEQTDREDLLERLEVGGDHQDHLAVLGEGDGRTWNPSADLVDSFQHLLEGEEAVQNHRLVEVEGARIGWVVAARSLAQGVDPRAEEGQNHPLALEAGAEIDLVAVEG